jgi:hypothetical protein
MAMNQRLLRPVASSLDKDAAIYLNAVAVQDGEQLEPAVKKAINDFVKGCKQDGIWDAIKACAILAGARTLNGALVALKGSNPTNNGPFVSGDYDRETGLVGNASTKYLDTNRNNNADGQNDQHMAVYVSTATASGGAYIGAGHVDSGSTHFGRTTTGLFSRNRNSAAQVGGTASQTGFIGVSRSASGSYVRRSGSSNSTLTQTSETPLNQNIWLYATVGPSSTNAPINLGSGRVAFYSVGSSLTLSTLQSRVDALYSAIGAAI